MVFVSSEPIDHDILSWCDDFTDAHFKAFVARELGAEGGHRGSRGDLWKPEPHHPVAIGVVPPSNRAPVTLKLARPCEGRYITVRLRTQLSAQSLTMSVRVSGMPASHPLAKHLGSDRIEDATAALVQEVLCRAPCHAMFWF